MKPSVGRIVHYVGVQTDDTKHCVASLVTGVGEKGQVDLVAFWPASLVFAMEVPFGRSEEPGSWHWPERVE